jgi:threonine dehydrogenase-like Zn-dependent dehydrogenase
MRAAVVAAPGVMRTEAVQMPEPGPGEIRVRLEGSGVCASNLAVWAGAPWFTYPLAPGAPGHEGWGTVDRIGAGVTNIREGQRVTGLSANAFAEFDLFREADLVELPTSLGDQPFPGEPLGCAFNIMRRSRIEPGMTVAVVGIGFLGAILTGLAATAGARVIALSRSASALELARSRGALETVLMDDHSRAVNEVAELTGRRFCDRVIECAGKQWPLDLAAEITGERRMLVIAGYHQDGARQINLQLWNWRGLDVVNAHERDPAIYMRGIREAVEAVSSGSLFVDDLYTHRYPLDRLGDALEAARNRPEGFIKALVLS